MSKTQDISRLRSVLATALKQGRAKFKDLQEVDFEAYYDSALKYEENKRLWLERFTYKELENDVEAEKEHIREIENHYEQEFKESVKRLKGGEQEQYFKGLSDYVGMVAKGFANSLIVEGVGGIGKTYEVLRSLSDLGVDYEYFNSYSTPLEFYQLLFEKNGKVIVLDDFEGILSSNVGISILKACMWSATDKRFVSYYTTSDKLTVPSKFEFSGQVIFCLNSLASNPEINALRTRALYYKLDFSVDDIKKIIVAIAKSKQENRLGTEDRVAVAEYIVENSDEATNDLNLRTLVKAYGAFEYAQGAGKDWKAIVNDLLVVDEEKSLLKHFLNQFASKKEARKAWCEETGRSPRTFQRVLKEMGLSRRYR
jgi:hypothetical protein